MNVKSRAQAFYGFMEMLIDHISSRGFAFWMFQKLQTWIKIFCFKVSIDWFLVRFTQILPLQSTYEAGKYKAVDSLNLIVKSEVSLRVLISRVIDEEKQSAWRVVSDTHYTWSIMSAPLGSR